MKPTTIARRLDDLEAAAQQQHGLPGCLPCQGLSLDEVLDRVFDAIPSDCSQLLDTLIGHVQEVEARPAYEIGEGQLVRDRHGFLWFIDLVRNGYSTVPQVLPRSWLELWTRDHRPGIDWHPPLR